METLKIRSSKDCRFDIVSLGEVMIRLDPGAGRIHTTRELQVWEGGGEYNVARGLARCFGKRGSIVTAIPENPVGRLLEDLIMQGGVDRSWIQWVPFDGIGRNTRVGLNFTERGFGFRGAVGCSDRGHSAASQMKPGDVDWDRLFGSEGVRWFHTGGIFAGLSASTADLVIEAVQAARKYGTVVSYDLNYRPSLWKSLGGQSAARTVNQRIAPYIDVMIGNEEDFGACLDLHVPGLDESFNTEGTEGFRHMIKEALEIYPDFKVIATTLRSVHSATINDWSAIIYANGNFYEATKRKHMEILDRVGGGDSFASGLIYAFLEDLEPALAVEYGAAHGALAMTTPGDTSMASLQEVKKLVAGGNARVDR